MGPRLYRPRLDHDSRRWFLLLWSSQAKERPQHDISLSRMPRCRLLPGMCMAGNWLGRFHVLRSNTPGSGSSGDSLLHSVTPPASSLVT